jgi:hypothetical protein
MPFDEDHLRAIVVDVLVEARAFDEWLSPDIIRKLISTYAKKSSRLGNLKWEYGQLPSNVWGRFLIYELTLRVNKTKTTDMFKKQVETILHEIQHWNQLVDFVDARTSGVRFAISSWFTDYKMNTRALGYFNNPYEVDARRFGEENKDAAIRAIGEIYGGRIKGELDDVVEELLDEYTDSEKPLTRHMISRTLVDYGFIGPKYMADVISQLRDLDVEIT